MRSNAESVPGHHRAHRTAATRAGCRPAATFRDGSRVPSVVLPVGMTVRRPGL